MTWISMNIAIITLYGIRDLQISKSLRGLHRFCTPANIIGLLHRLRHVSIRESWLNFGLIFGNAKNRKAWLYAQSENSVCWHNGCDLAIEDKREPLETQNDIQQLDRRVKCGAVLGRILWTDFASPIGTWIIID